jgi:hypothetical protein
MDYIPYPTLPYPARRGRPLLKKLVECGSVENYFMTLELVTTRVSVARLFPVTGLLEPTGYVVHNR